MSNLDVFDLFNRDYSREQLESLFTAKDLGVASAQEYLAGDSGMKQVQVSRKENVNALAG